MKGCFVAYIAQKRKNAEVQDSMDVIFLDLWAGAKLIFEFLSIWRVYCNMEEGVLLFGSSRAISTNLSFQMAF